MSPDEPRRKPTKMAALRERAPEPGERYAFSSLRGRFLAAALPVFFVALTIVIGIEAGVPWGLLAVPVVIILGLFVWRALHVALELQLDRVVVRNTYRTYELRWADVEWVYDTGKGGYIAFGLRDKRLGVEAVGTYGATRNRPLFLELRRYAEPYSIQFDLELPIE